MPRSRRDLPDPTRTAVAAPESPRAVAAPGTGRRLRRSAWRLTPNLVTHVLTRLIYFGLVDLA